MEETIYHTSFEPMALFYMEEASRNATIELREFITPEAFLHALMFYGQLDDVLSQMGVDDQSIDNMRHDLIYALSKIPHRDLSEGEEFVTLSRRMYLVITRSLDQAKEAGRDTTNVPLMVREILHLKNSLAADMLKSVVGDREDEFIALLAEAFPDNEVPPFGHLVPDEDWEEIKKETFKRKG